MKKLIFLLALCLMLPAASAQKMVIGSKVPDFKGVQWQSSAPASGKPMIVEFYNPDNSSSARFFPKLAEIKSKYGNKLEVVVLIQNGSTIGALNTSGYAIGTDPDGKVYQNFNVQFLPYTILVSSKGELFWQGNLGNITDDVLQRVK